MHNASYGLFKSTSALAAHKTKRKNKVIKILKYLKGDIMYFTGTVFLKFPFITILKNQ